MNKPKEKKKSSRAPSPFDFCTKHTHSFYATCGCLNKRKEPEKEIFPEDTLFDIKDENA